MRTRYITIMIIVMLKCKPTWWWRLGCFAQRY
jgi:hypothetical protein